ncbi:MAG: vitamin K epoxide reductase family protein [Bacteriovoracia bacterium]
MTKNVSRIKEVLRSEDTDDLNRRRLIIKLSALGLVDFTIITFYQTGIIQSLPDLPLKIFNSDEVNGSDKAYEMGLPDGTTAITVYGLVMMLASFGGKKGVARSRTWDWLLMAAISANSLAGLEYLYNMAFKQKKVCLYCVSGALINLSMVSPALKNLRN